MKFQLGENLFELMPAESPGHWTYSQQGPRGRLGDARIVDVREVEPGIYSILCEGRSYEVHAGLAPESLTWAAVDGRRYELDLRDPRDRRAGSGGGARTGEATLKAPMPGKVVRMLVAEGERVEAGQGLAVVEAMKMQNEMKAPRAGVVKSVKAKEGSTVAAGEVLLVIE